MTGLRHIPVCVKPIFVIGSPRSGTSILAWSLAQHSALWTSSESDVLYNIFGGDRVARAFEASEARTEATWMRENGVSAEEFTGWLGFGINALYTNRSGGKRWVEQTPLNTILVNVLATMFPDALFLHVLRDGRRVVNSMMNFHRLTGDEMRMRVVQSGQLPAWASDVTVACRTWRDFVETAMDFNQRWPARCLTVRNEDLVVNAESEFRNISEFLQIDYNSVVPEFFSSHRINSSFRADSTERAWVRALSEPWLEWPSAWKRTFAEEAGATLVKYGLADPRELILSSV